MVHIEAIHALSVAEAIAVPLVFLTGSDSIGDAQVTVDGVPVTLDLRRLEEPVAWQPPDTTPGLGGGDPVRLPIDAPTTELVFEVDLGPGPHTLAVRYAVFPARQAWGAEPTVVWQLGYVLAPARRWGGFGGLDVEVWVPPGWAAAADPALQRRGDALLGRFDGLPADHVVLTLQAPAGPWHPILAVAGPTVWLAVVLSGPLGLRWLVRWGLRRGPGRWVGGVTSALAVLWWVAFLAATGFALASGGLGIDPLQRANEPDYLDIILFFAAMIAGGVAASLAVMGVQATAVIAARR